MHPKDAEGTANRVDPDQTAPLANSVDPDQTAPLGAVWSGSALFAPELQLNKANTSDTKAPFLDLHLSISNGFVSSKI